MNAFQETARVPVVKTRTHSGIPMIMGAVPAGALVDRCVIPHRDRRRNVGYQREVSTARVNRLIRDLKEKRVDLPTAILVNLREFDPAKHLLSDGGSTVFILDGDELHVVDGQHRIEALRRLVEDDETRWSGFEVPFVCMLGADESQEMRQFYVVNSTAKSVRTDLALDLLKKQAESDPKIMEALVESGESWKVRAQQLVEDVEKTPIWKGCIRFPGDQRAGTTVGSAGMVSSLKSLLSTPYFGSITTPNQVKVLTAYWSGIKKVIPEAFEEPAEYTLQKSTGVMIMHSLLVAVLEYVRSTGRSVVEPEPYADALQRALLELEGDTSSGDVARGSDFWLAGSEGAAGSFSSNAGRRVLLAKLKSMLPEIEVE